MAVKRIVTNIATHDLTLAKPFYQDILELNIAMDFGWIATYQSGHSQNVLISFASQGGSDTPVPHISIEVDNIDHVYTRMQESGFNIVYELVTEPWGVRRFYVDDPFGQTINVLEHSESTS